MNTHTPGPWNIHRVTKSNGLYKLSVGKLERSITRVCIPTNVSMHNQMEADAKLIAAAPTLLLALQNIINHPGTNWATNQAIFAIDKATGESDV